MIENGSFVGILLVSVITLIKIKKMVNSKKRTQMQTLKI